MKLKLWHLESENECLDDEAAREPDEEFCTDYVDEAVESFVKGIDDDCENKTGTDYYYVLVVDECGGATKYQVEAEFRREYYVKELQ